MHFSPRSPYYQPDPLSQYQHADSDNIDRVLASFFSQHDPCASHFLGADAHMDMQLLLPLLDKLDTVHPDIWLPALYQLFYVCHGAYTHHSNNESWIAAFADTHIALAKYGLLGAIWPRITTLVAAWIRSLPTNLGYSPKSPLPQDDLHPLLLALACVHAHVAACRHFAISLPLSEPSYLLFFMTLLARVDIQHVPSFLVKKISLLVHQLFLCQFGGRHQLHAIKSSLYLFYQLPSIAPYNESPQSPTPESIKTKVTDNDLHSAFNELTNRYPTASSVHDLVTPLIPSPNTPTTHSNNRLHFALPPAKSTTRRAFNARKKIVTQDHLLLPGGLGADYKPPKPIRESIQTYLSHHHPNLETVLIHQRPRGVPPHTEWSFEYPAEFCDHFNELEGSLYPQLLPYLSQYIAQLVTILRNNLPIPSQYPGLKSIENSRRYDPPPYADRRDRELQFQTSVHNLLLLFQHFRLAHPLLGEHVGNLIDDEGGLTWLTQFLMTMEDSDAVLRGESMDSQCEPVWLQHVLLPNPGYIHRNVHLVTNALHLITLLVRRKPHRVHVLYQAKAFNPLRRLIAYTNAIISTRALKLMKLMMPFMSRKWRQSNIDVISLIYHQLKPKLVDDYLMTSDVEVELAEGQKQVEANSLLIAAFHKTRYPDAYQKLLDRQATLQGTVVDGYASPNEPLDVWYHYRISSTPSVSSSSSSSYSDEIPWLCDSSDEKDDEDGILEEWRDEYEDMQVDEWWKCADALYPRSHSSSPNTPRNLLSPIISSPKLISPLAHLPTSPRAVNSLGSSLTSSLHLIESAVPVTKRT